jgi:hypothetical protein
MYRMTKIGARRISNLKHSDTCPQSVRNKCKEMWKCIKTHDFRLQPRNIRQLRSSGLLRSVAVLPYRSFGTSSWQNFKGHECLILDVGPIDCLQIMSSHCHCSLRNIQEEPKSNTEPTTLLLRNFSKTKIAKFFILYIFSIR